MLEVKGLVNGLTITNWKLEGKCVDCLVGKAVRSPFNAEVDPEEEVLERVHADMTGPLHTTARGEV